MSKALHCITVSVYDVESKRNFPFEVWLERLRDFYRFAVTNRRHSALADLPGISPMACRGLEAIFVRIIPPAFRLNNFLEYLEREQTVYGPQTPDYIAGFWDRVRGKKTTYKPLLDPPLTIKEIEGALELFWKLYDE